MDDPGTDTSRRRADAVAAPLERAFGEALRSGDPAATTRAVQEVLGAGLSAAEAQTRVIAPAMRWIGELWERGEISVADEHLATALSYQALTILYPELLRRGIRCGRVVLVGAPRGEHHVLGLRMAADILEGAGYDVRYLGADVPAAAVAGWVVEHEPAAVLLGLTMPSAGPALTDLLARVHEVRPEARLLVGGQGVPARLRAIPGIAYVPDTEGLLPVLDAALTGPPPAELSDLLPRSAGSAVAGRTSEDGGSVAARLATAVFAASDIAREQARRAFTLEQLAFRDPLTELPNRRAFDERYEQLLSGAAHPPAILMIDIDRFKIVNDTHGHGAGDRALIGVARCIDRAVRASDFPARYAGDEFAVLLPATRSGDAVRIGERIRELVENEVSDPPVSVSVGVCASGPLDRRAATLDADRALYQAKQGGRNRVVLAGLEDPWPSEPSGGRAD